MQSNASTTNNSSTSSSPSCIRLMIVGAAGSGSGKSTICLSILGSLLQSGLYDSNELAYIKPCTQGIQQTLVAKWCKSHSISYRHVGPLVFFRGLTRKYLAGELDPDFFIDEDTRQTLLHGKEESNTITTKEQEIDSKMLQQMYTETWKKRILEAVEAIGEGKRIVLIDGVGYPAVGSICGVSNATVANICDAKVLIVGKAGLGDCIDSWNQARTYMESVSILPNSLTSSTSSIVLGLLVNRVREGGEAKKTEGVRMLFSEEGCFDVTRRYRLYGIVREQGYLFENEEDNSTNRITDSSYAPPGEHNQCSITFKPPSPEQLHVDPLLEHEKKICDGLIAGFAENVPMETLKLLLQDCQVGHGRD